MKIIDGFKVATPMRRHIIACIDEMQDDVLYPLGTISEIVMPRGRRLGEALSNDPIAPKPISCDGIPSNMRCYYKSQIVEYFNSYSDDYLDISKEISYRVQQTVRNSEIHISIERSKIDKERSEMSRQIADVVERSVKKFTAQFLEKYGKRYYIANSACGIYFLRRLGKVVYVGQSRNVYVRLGDHISTKDFDEVVILPCEPDDLDNLEGFYIRLLQPEMNAWKPDANIGAPSSILWDSIQRTIIDEK